MMIYSHLRVVTVQRGMGELAMAKSVVMKTKRPGPRTAKKRPAVFQTFLTTVTPTAAKIDVIRSGLPARVVDDMAEYLDVPKHVIFGVLHTPESTAHKLIKDNRSLDSAASER